jgi:hypothetical protein
MRTLATLACSMAILTGSAVIPARAQFGGNNDQFPQFGASIEQLGPMLEQMAPMMESMTRTIGRKRMRQLIETAAPLMAGMMGGEAAFGDGVSGMESFAGSAAPPARKKKRVR